MPDESDLDIAHLFPEDPQGKAAAMVNALRGQQGLAQEMAYYGSGDPFKAVPQMMNEQASQGLGMIEQEKGREVTKANALREYMALKNQLRHQTTEEDLAKQRNEREKAHQGFEEGMAKDKFAHEKEEQLNGQAEKLGKEMEPLTASDAVLTQLETALKQPGSLPGVGPVVGNLPPAVISDQGKKLRSLVETAGLQGDRAISGSTGFGRSPEMATKLQAATQMLKTGTDEGIRQGTKLLRELHETAKNATLQGYRPEVQSIYQSRAHPVQQPAAKDVKVRVTQLRAQGLDASAIKAQLRKEGF